MSYIGKASIWPLLYHYLNGKYMDISRIMYIYDHGKHSLQNCTVKHCTAPGQKLSGLWTTLQPSLSSTAFLQRAPTLK